MPELNLGGHIYNLTAHRNYFINPATAEQYAWLLNHEDKGDEGTEKKRSITTTANTGNVGLIRQQSSDEPLILKRKGKIIDTTQEKEMWRWFQLCKTQTIYFVEFNEDAYEVQITDLKMKRIGAARVRSGEPYFVEYEIEMEVYTVLTGVLASAGISA
jgi:hypothetical protein